MSDQKKAPMKRGLVSARKRPPPRDRNVPRNTDDQRKEQVTRQMNAMASNLIKSKSNNSSASRKRRAADVIATPSISVDVNKRKTVTLVQSTEMSIQGTMTQLQNFTAPTNVTVAEVDPENRAQIYPNPANPPMNDLSKKLAQDFLNDGPSIDMMFTPNVNGLNLDAIKVSSAVVAAWGLHNGEAASPEDLANSSDFEYFDWDENGSMVTNDRGMLRQSYLSLLKFLHTSEPMDNLANLMNVIELLYDPCAFTKLATAVCIAQSVRWMSTENLDLLITAIENLSSVDSRTFNAHKFVASCAHLRKILNMLEMVDPKIHNNLTYDIQQSLKAFVQPMSRIECTQCDELACYSALCQTYFLITEIHHGDIPLNVTLKKFEELRVKANGKTVTIRTSIRGQEMSGSAK